ncbi:hypothetical protein OHA71_23635 [Streptomyces sp. NBC_00444]|uniref:hypothetical protein n=1 Tax=Streptomyces sp. NBC_00444 TaxID=2975744 RepID=UPI002E212C41
MGVLIAGAAMVAFACGRASWSATCAGISLGNAVQLLANVLVGSTTRAGALAGVVAVGLWLWWNRGGGDDTKRRIRKWARKFQGVRRTAPAVTP